jgi:mono/diheme cytochrome c family protein
MDNNKKKFEEEIDYKAVLKNPVRWFGIIYPYFFLVVFVIGVYYVSNIEKIAKNSVPTPLDTAKAEKGIEMKKGKTLPPVDLSIIQNPSQDLISQGEQLYSANCASCHGDNGEGNGPAAATLDPQPRSFASKEGWINGRDFYSMYKTLEEGIQGSGMSAYEYMPPKDRIATILHVRTLAEFQKVTDEQVQNMDRDFNLSEGTKTANQIPVDLAKKVIMEENRPLMAKVDSMAKYTLKFDRLEGSEIFDRVVRDRKRVFSSFIASNLSDVTVGEFIDKVTADPLTNGFSADVMSLSDEEWRILYTYIKKLMIRYSV